MAAPMVVATTDLAGDGSVIQVTWNHLDATNNTGAAIAFSQWADRSVQITGCFNTANVVWEGSNDNGNSFLPLSNPQGTALNVGVPTFAQVTEVAGLARPRTTSGGTGQDIVVSAVLRRATQLVRG